MDEQPFVIFEKSKHKVECLSQHTCTKSGVLSANLLQKNKTFLASSFAAE